MHNCIYEMTGIIVKKFVNTCEDGDCVVYEEYDKVTYIKKLSQYITKFVNDKLNYYEKTFEELSEKFISQQNFVKRLKTL